MKVIISITLLFCSIACLSDAFTLYKPNVKWFSSPEFIYHPENGPACCLSPKEEEDALYAGKNVWPIFRNISSGGELTAEWADLGTDTLGVTRNHYVKDSCQDCAETFFFKEVGSTVTFSNKVKWELKSECTNGFDLQGVAAHEFGHSAGLAHSSDSEATMARKLPACSNSWQSLEQDDLKGYDSIYVNRCGKQHVGNCSWITVKARASINQLCPAFTGFGVLSGATYNGQTQPPSGGEAYLIPYAGPPKKVWVDADKPRIILKKGSFKIEANYCTGKCSAKLTGACKGFSENCLASCLAPMPVVPKAKYCAKFTCSWYGSACTDLGKQYPISHYDESYSFRLCQ
jgi:hypothetical protein